MYAFIAIIFTICIGIPAAAIYFADWSAAKKARAQHRRLEARLDEIAKSIPAQVMMGR